jgi:MerR family copper efflux transcriptional regulator
VTGAPARAAEAQHHIGEVAAAVGLSLRTIRYYEEVGIAPPSGRSAGGFRLYTDADIERLRVVKSFKPLNFSLDDVRDLMGLRDRIDAGEVLDDEETARLVGYAGVAAIRSQQLREQLEAVESLARVLERQASAARRTTRRGRRS